MPFNLLSKFAVKQTGGNMRATWASSLTIMLISILVLTIKVVLVQWSYNEVVPKISDGGYRKLTTVEALYLVILVQSLFN